MGVFFFFVVVFFCCVDNRLRTRLGNPFFQRIKEGGKKRKNKFIYFQIKFESIREVYKKQQQPIFFFNISCCKNVKGEK